MRSLLFYLLLVCTASASNFLVVPGQRLGSVRLGMTHQQMRAALGKSNATVRLDSGVIREDWLAKALAPKAYVEDGRYFQHDFVTAYFRDDRATQIEVSSATFKTTEGLSTASNAQQFRQRYPHFMTISPPHFSNRDPGGCPATKHYVAYEDAATRGIAWRYGAWGNLAPDPNPHTLEIVIVHRRGEPVLVDPDGGVRLVWKVPPHELMEHYPSH